MLNSISSFFFGSSAEEPTTEMSTETTTTATTSVPLQGAHCRLKETATEEEEWILIDKSSREGSPDRRSSSSSSSPFVHPAARPSPHRTTTGVVLPAGGESSDSDIGSDISTLPDNACSGETWLVTPPPCFTAGGNSPQRMEQSPLENLLIEHPSMSVYGPRLRQNSAGIESDISESSETGEPSSHLPASRRAGARTAAAVRSSPRQPRAVAARAGLSSTQQTVKAAQVAVRKSKKRQFSANQMARDNLTSHRVAKRQRNRVQVVQPAPRSAAKRC